jgi:WS/DGAT/MGAT family acyltransferase
MFFSEREGLGPSVLPGAASSQKTTPNFLELLSGSYENFFRQQQELLKSLPDIGNAIGSLFTRMLSNLSKGEMEPLIAPKTILNVSVSNERCCGLCTVPFQDVKTISKAASAKINDVVLAICAGALRRYLEARNALPEESLLVAVPASLRDPGNTDMNNQVTIMRCSLHTNIADPIDRLESIKKSTSDSKALLGEIKGALITDFSWLGAPIILTSMSQLISRTKAADQLPALVNLAISNVPGPRSDLRFAGARITHNYPISIAGHGAVLNITVHSYLDQLDFGTIACRRAVPDVQTINDLIVEETAALLNAARAGTNGR